jgi:hypothetical protein
MKKAYAKEASHPDHWHIVEDASWSFVAVGLCMHIFHPQKTAKDRPDARNLCLGCVAAERLRDEAMRELGTGSEEELGVLHG